MANELDTEDLDFPGERLAYRRTRSSTHTRPLSLPRSNVKALHDYQPSRYQIRYLAPMPTLAQRIHGTHGLLKRRDGKVDRRLPTRALVIASKPYETFITAEEVYCRSLENFRRENKALDGSKRFHVGSGWVLRGGEMDQLDSRWNIFSCTLAPLIVTILPREYSSDNCIRKRFYYTPLS